MRRLQLLALAGTLATFGSCLFAPPLEMPTLANARVSSDFDSYEIRRVGLMPFLGKDLLPSQARALQLGLYAELGQATPYEVVLLEHDDLEEVEISEPFRRGWYRPRTIIDLSKRYSLDAVLFGKVTQQRFYPPQVLSLNVEMVSAETGLVVWSSAVHLDATDQRVLDGLQVFFGSGGTDRKGGRKEDDWRLALLSPERFARFAAYQIASML